MVMFSASLLLLYRIIIRSLKTDAWRMIAFAICCLIVFLLPYIFLVFIYNYMGVSKNQWDFFAILVVWGSTVLGFSLYLRVKGYFKNQ
jgi:hypothetical protein